MPFIPHTKEDVAAMLDVIGVDSMDSLFDEIPASLRQVTLSGIPDGLSEMALGRDMKKLAQADGEMLNFIGAGAYEHHIPAAVWEVATRGEFYSAYTPYQAEASQGSLQLIYEFQTMMANLLAMEVANASLYDGASAFAEAILMAVRLSPQAKRTQILMPNSVHPHYRMVVEAIVKQQDIQIVDLPYQSATGTIDIQALSERSCEEVAALVIPQNNFFGVLEDVDALTDWAVTHGILTIGLVNPLGVALLKPPGQWGQEGVDIACGEGQPLGIPLAGGGPYYGFMCTRKRHVRQMPGRIVGATVDKTGKTGYVLTLQAREQHIRRAKATSNICTNQGLMVTASTIFMSLLGPLGLRQVALKSHDNTRLLAEKLRTLVEVERVFTSPFFHELVIRINSPIPVQQVINSLAQERIQAGYALEQYYPELKNCLLVCATETKTTADIAYFVERLGVVIADNAKNREKTACQTI